MRAILMISSLAMAGTERNIVSLMPYIRDEGVDLRLVSMNTRRDSPLAEEFAASGIPRFDLDAARMTDTAAWSRFTTMLREEQIDVVHAQDQDTIIYAALAHRRLGMPTAMSRHVLFEPADTAKEWARAQMVLFAAKHGFNRVVAVSEAVRQDFAKKTGLSLDKIETIYNGLPMARFDIDESRAALRTRFGWDANTPIVTMVAVLRRGKGHEVLFDAIPALRERVPNVKIMLVGDGEIEDKVRELAAPYSETVVFLGQRTDVPHILKASDALVLPSWAEALPTVLIEAGAAGIPAVSTDVGGAKEITLDGDTGYIVPPGDVAKLAERLADVLSDPDRAAQMGERARARVEATFSLQRQAAQFVDMYRRIIDEQSGK